MTRKMCLLVRMSSVRMHSTGGDTVHCYGYLHQPEVVSQVQAGCEGPVCDDGGALASGTHRDGLGV